jgi:hypothetical protein
MDAAVYIKSGTAEIEKRLSYLKIAVATALEYRNLYRRG